MKKTFFAAVCGLLLASCGNGGEEIVPAPEQTKIPINIAMNAWGRVTDTAYEQGDKVGIYVVNYSNNAPGVLAAIGNHVDNMRFTLSGTWTPDAEIYWGDKTTQADFYCYYPYATPTNVAAHSVNVKPDQSSEAAYKASEHLWGKASGISPTATAVPITTTHSMSNMLIYVVPGEGFTEEALAEAAVSVRICNVKTAGTMNLATGVVTATGAAGEVVPFKEADCYRALIVPQTVADGLNLITVTVDGVDYTLAKGFTFVGGKQHKFTVNINKVGGGIDIGVGGWETDDTDNGGAAE